MEFDPIPIGHGMQYYDQNKTSEGNIERNKLFESSMNQTEIRFLQDKLSSSRFYLEFGSGFSTLEALVLVREQIISIETSSDYIVSLSNFIKEKGFDRTKVFFHHADIGETKIWGHPSDDQQIKNWPKYSKVDTDSYSKSFKPDLALIDGRFRVATFINLFLSYPGLSIIFDDYMDRPQYHVVEEVLEPIETCGRIAFFKIPKIKKNSKLTRAIRILQDSILNPD